MDEKKYYLFPRQQYLKNNREDPGTILLPGSLDAHKFQDGDENLPVNAWKAFSSSTVCFVRKKLLQCSHERAISLPPDGPTLGTRSPDTFLNKDLEHGGHFKLLARHFDRCCH